MRAAAAALALAVLASGCAGLRAEVNEKALHPRPEYELWPDEMGLEAEDVFVPVDGLRLHGWLVEADKPKATIVLFHGNYPNASPYVMWLHDLHAHHYNALVVNYRGFGASEGEADCWSLGRDAEAIVAWLDSRPALAKLPVGVLGISLGTMPALSVGVSCPRVGAVVLDSPFLPRKKLDQALGGFFATLAAPFLVPGELDSLALAARLERPLLVIHGAQDWIAEPEGAVEIAEKAKGPSFLWIAPDAGHAPGVAGFYDAIYDDAIHEFFDTWLVGEGSRVWLAGKWKPTEGGRVHVGPFVVRGEVKASVPVELLVASHVDGHDAPKLAWWRFVWHPGEPGWDGPVTGEPIAARVFAFDQGDVELAGDSWQSKLSREARSNRAIEKLGSEPDEKAIDEALAQDLDPVTRPALVRPLLRIAAEKEDRGDRAGAIRCCERALELAGSVAQGRVLGDAHWELGTDASLTAQIHRKLASLLGSGLAAERARHEALARELDERAAATKALRATKLREVLRERELAPTR